jgi:hypothetical protein
VFDSGALAEVARKIFVERFFKTSLVLRGLVIMRAGQRNITGCKGSRETEAEGDPAESTGRDVATD